MNLRITPIILASALSISSSTKSVSEANSGANVKVAVRLIPFQEDATEKFTARQRSKRIPTSMFDQGSAHGHRFDYPDVGILQGMTHRRLFGGGTMYGGVQRGTHAVDVRRFLQAEESPLCGTNGTCAPGFCAAKGSRLTNYAAAVELNAICTGYTDADGKNFTFEGCIPEYFKAIPGLQKYARYSSCKLAQCVVEGGSAETCYCQLYHAGCIVYGDERPFDVSAEL